MAREHETNLDDLSVAVDGHQHKGGPHRDDAPQPRHRWHQAGRTLADDLAVAPDSKDPRQEINGAGFGILDETKDKTANLFGQHHHPWDVHVADVGGVAHHHQAMALLDGEPFRELGDDVDRVFRSQHNRRDVPRGKTLMESLWQRVERDGDDAPSGAVHRTAEFTIEGSITAKQNEARHTRNLVAGKALPSTWLGLERKGDFRLASGAFAAQVPCPLRRRRRRRYHPSMATLPLGELFVVGFGGYTVPESTQTLIADHGVGGVILFSRNIDDTEQVVGLNTSLYELAKARGAPLIVSVDQEGGRVARLRGLCSDVPSMRIVGKAAETDPEVPYRLGAMMARELLTLGFHWDFAPVADVDTNPDNPVIGERSFSRDPAVVGRLVARFIQGMQGAGVAACAKHFPGHGDTDTDSHLALPRLPHSLERLNAIELAPFVAAKDAGVASVMTAHVMFPALDDNEPATLSPVILKRLLRDQLGYDGVCVSDDLEMAAVAERYDVEVLVEKGLNAGCDLFLICHDNDKAARAIEAAHRLVDTGAVPRERAEEALRRVQAMKSRYVGAPAPPSMAEVKEIVRSAPHLALSDSLKAIADDGPQRDASMVDLA